MADPFLELLLISPPIGSDDPSPISTDSILLDQFGFIRDGNEERDELTRQHAVGDERVPRFRHRLTDRSSQKSVGGDRTTADPFLELLLIPPPIGSDDPSPISTGGDRATADPFVELLLIPPPIGSDDPSPSSTGGDRARADPFLELLLIPPPIGSDDPSPISTDSILLDQFGFISDRENTTTAEGKTSGGHTIWVTFWPAQPPRVSVFTVYCPGLPNYSFGDFPRIITTEADFVMLRVAICRRGNHLYPRSNDYFMYKVASDPDDLKLAGNETVLLRCRSRNMYFIARLSNRAPNLHEFDIHLYNSEDTKVITFGGPLGSVGWVDLWRGILICDLLQYGRHLRYIPLPLPSVPKVLKGPPSRVGTSWSSKPNLKEGEEDTEAILKRLYARCPSLSLHHDGVVYIANKLEHQDDKQWVIAVDMNHKTLHDVAYYYPGRRLIYGHPLVESEISKHLATSSTTRYYFLYGSSLSDFLSLKGTQLDVGSITETSAGLEADLSVRLFVMIV
ncbi:hypothetical protein PR202_gb23081 [Eleusine coracana subsp. coracana]|uniref:DUF1618 domain-containing protein n=1 Tax=Eleusine coracana subsp. coracana TaxID=191504 RepID=A0AAV5FFC2_ELECO|nr:hypothetical protein PR202_gb23081 [Eleusine coracana subsp. coracana]